MPARSSSVRAISTATENMTYQPFEFLLLIIKNGRWSCCTSSLVALFFWKMDRQQEAYNIILPGRWYTANGLVWALSDLKFHWIREDAYLLAWPTVPEFIGRWSSWIIEVNFLNILQWEKEIGHQWWRDVFEHQYYAIYGICFYRLVPCRKLIADR